MEAISKGDTKSASREMDIFNAGGTDDLWSAGRSDDLWRTRRLDDFGRLGCEMGKQKTPSMALKNEQGAASVAVKKELGPLVLRAASVAETRELGTLEI